MGRQIASRASASPKRLPLPASREHSLDSLNLDPNKTLNCFHFQDFARFGVVELDEKQRLYRLIKAIQARQQPSSQQQQQWCLGGRKDAAPLSPAAATPALCVEVAADASEAFAPSPSSAAGPPPPPPPQLRLSSPGGGGQQQQQHLKPWTREEEPARANAPSLPGALASFEIDVSQEALLPAEEEASSVVPAALEEYSPPSPPTGVIVGMESSPPAVKTATAAAAPPPLPPSPPSPRIKVVVRKRPLNAAERSRGEADVLDARAADRTVVVAEPRCRVDCSRYVELQQFEFDAVLDEAASADDVYAAAVGPLVRACCRQGGRATAFAYGQTGSGKTHTMGRLPERAAADLLERMRRWEARGGEGEDGGGGGEGAGGAAAPSPPPPRAAAAPSGCSHGLWVSCFEIYGGKLFDLLNARNRLDAREDAQGRVVIARLRHARVRSATDVAAVAAAAERARSTGSTGANADSSRSHCVTQFSLYRLPPSPAAGGTRGDGSRAEGAADAGGAGGSRAQSSSAAARRQRAEDEAAARGEEEAERAAATARAAVERAREEATAASGAGASPPALPPQLTDALLAACLSSPAPPNPNSNAAAAASATAALAAAAAAAASSSSQQQRGRPPLPCPGLVGKLSFIDLAGSERGADVGDKAGAATRLEGAQINRSLLALKECIRALDSRRGGAAAGDGRRGSGGGSGGGGGGGAGHVPFRGSKLTEVLRDSFVGANSRTVMVATVAPGERSCEHTLNTLRYADRVKELRSGAGGGGGGGKEAAARGSVGGAGGEQQQRQQRLLRAARRASLNGLPAPALPLLSTAHAGGAPGSGGGSGAAPRPRRASSPPKLSAPAPDSSCHGSSLAPPFVDVAEKQRQLRRTGKGAAATAAGTGETAEASVGAATAATRALSLGGARRVSTALLPPSAALSSAAAAPFPSPSSSSPEAAIKAAHRLSIERAMAGLRLEMALLAGAGDLGGGARGSGASGGSDVGRGGGSRKTQQQQQSFSEYAAELEAALDERAAAAGVVREELARWRQAQQQQQ